MGNGDPRGACLPPPPTHFFVLLVTGSLDSIAIHNILQPYIDGRSGKQGALWLSSCELGVHGEFGYHRWIRHSIHGVTLQEAVRQWMAGNCTDPESRCRWIEPCDWTREYEHNMSLVEKGHLKKCWFRHTLWQAGTVLEFRPAGSKCENPTV
eukprot:NODE_2243_length_960_cov_26.362239_g1848_i0.p1 GENE.NODE_2243_length_960_cov_26.362239_g1848_i0~~NODE_2243_length_960_cov_26.362239_g1848_i0.p1  ORF type:complete len:152 (+),score=22.65 NODE_2243_length_960_cov_26.362239_g1848_i0:444-899(+)